MSKVIRKSSEVRKYTKRVSLPQGLALNLAVGRMKMLVNSYNRYCKSQTTRNCQNLKFKLLNAQETIMVGQKAIKFKGSFEYYKPHI